MSPHANSAFNVEMNASNADERPVMAQANRGTNEMINSGMSSMAMNRFRESSPR
jgi:hypothetical protein